MNLLEAVKSGKPFKRSNFDSEIWFKNVETHIKNRNSENPFLTAMLIGENDESCPLIAEDVLAENWIVKEELLPCPFPCPFCGEEVELKCDESYKKTPRTLKYLIKCETKDCSVRYFVNDGDFIGYLNADNISDNLKIFVEKWNNRVGKVRND